MTRAALVLALSLTACAARAVPGDTKPKDKDTADAPATSVPEGASGDPGASRTGVPAGLRASEPVVCIGTDSIVVTGVYIRTDGDGVTVRGPCDVTVRDSTIVAGRYGLLIQGGGNILIEGSTVEGKSAAVAIPGMGSVKAKRTRFKGFVSLTGGGDLSDGGGNKFE